MQTGDSLQVIYFWQLLTEIWLLSENNFAANCNATEMFTDRRDRAKMLHFKILTISPDVIKPTVENKVHTVNAVCSLQKAVKMSPSSCAIFWQFEQCWSCLCSTLSPCLGCSRWDYEFYKKDGWLVAVKENVCQAELKQSDKTACWQMKNDMWLWSNETLSTMSVAALSLHCTIAWL